MSILIILYLVTCIVTPAIAQPPICDAGPPASGFVGEFIQFDGSGSSGAPGRIIVDFAWQFGDGATGAGEMPQHIYASPDFYFVTLTVTDDDGVVSSCITTAEIFDEQGPPICDAGGPYVGAVGEPIQFDGSGSSAPNGTIAAYDWEFGDGNAGSGVMLQHVYDADQVYTVTLTITDDDGVTRSCATTAAVSPVPVEPSTWGRIKALYEDTRD